MKWKDPPEKNNNNEAYYEVKIAYILFPLFTDNLENKNKWALYQIPYIYMRFCLNLMVYEMCDQVNTVQSSYCCREASGSGEEEMRSWSLAHM